MASMLGCNRRRHSAPKSRPRRNVDVNLVERVEEPVTAFAEQTDELAFTEVEASVHILEIYHADGERRHCLIAKTSCIGCFASATLVSEHRGR